VIHHFKINIMKKQPKQPLKINNYVLIPEYRFHKTIRWRFDFAFIQEKIAIEIEGGAYINGRHNRGTGFIKDMIKYNAANVLGWHVLRYTPQQFKTYSFINDLNDLICNRYGILPQNLNDYLNLLYNGENSI